MSRVVSADDASGVGVLGTGVPLDSAGEALGAA